MKVLKHTKVILIAVILVVGAVSTVLVVDGRKREDPSDVVWEGVMYDGFKLKLSWDFSIFENTLYVPANRGSDIIAVDIEDDELLWNYSYDYRLTFNSISEEQGLIYVGSTAGEVLALDTETGEKQWNHTHKWGHPDLGQEISSVFSSDNIVFSASPDGTVIAADARTGEELWQKKYHDKRVNSIYSYDGVVYTGSSDGSITAVDEQNGEKLWSNSYQDAEVWSLYVQDGVIYSGLSDGTLTAYDTESREEIWSRSHHSDTIYSVHAGEDMVYSGCSNATVIAASLEDGEKIWMHDFHNERSSRQNWANGVFSIQVVDEKVYSLDNSRCIAVEKEGSLTLGVSRSLSAFGGALSSYIVEPILDHWLIFLLILAGIGSSIALLVGEDEEKREVRGSKRK